MIIALLLAALAQEAAEDALYKKVDTQIPWISDGVRLFDNAQPGRQPADPQVDRAQLLAKAQEEAARRKRLILWYCMRVPGTHMYRGELVDNYMRTAIFTDPGVVDLVTSKFVAVRMAADEKLYEKYGGKRFEFVEPGFFILAPDGTLVHKIDRIRTFNPDWVRAVLVAVLKKDGAHNAPAGESVEDLIKGGDDDLAFPKASPDQKARILRRAGRFEEVLKLDCSPVQKGIALLGLQQFADARGMLAKEATPEALYHLAACDAWTGKNPDARWRELVEKFPDSSFAWRAASNLAKGRDTLRDGPMAHHFEDFFLVPPKGTPTRTMLPSKDPDEVIRRAVTYLLRAQKENGAWNDARYSYWPDVKIQPNLFVAITTLAAMALKEWRDVDPVRIEEAVARAEKYILDEDHLNPGQNEECYAHAYRLMYLAKKGDVPAMNRIILKLVALQDKDGFWGHEYPNPFASAAVVHCLHLAKQAGADVPDSYFKKAADALAKTRAADGRQAYDSTRGPSNEKSSMGRISMCELALWECGRGPIENVANALEAYWRQLEKLETIRVCDFHSDEELGGFFFFNAVYHSCEAARALPDAAKRKEHLAKFRSQILSIPEWDGSFLDSHELGKSYGTAMALLILR